LQQGQQGQGLALCVTAYWEALPTSKGRPVWKRTRSRLLMAAG
jgi:hypothetical protein